MSPIEITRSLHAAIREAPSHRPGLSRVELPKAQSRSQRPTAKGKFLFLGEEKLWVRGVTYGTFRPDGAGSDYHNLEVVERDFAQIAANGMNAVRTYTVPPRWLLDAAERHGLHVMVGLPWEQHVDFLGDKNRARSIEERVRAGVRACAAHPAVLCYAIGNEIPSPIARWVGRRRVECFIERLCRAGREEDPGGLFTYVNYPSTEYLYLPSIDLVAFNVYLESQERLEVYLARLHNLCGGRPLILAEIGLDSLRHGERAQAYAIDWQARTTFAAGCAGAFVFAWTDEWHRAGHDIEDWKFGLVERDRRPKLALAAIREACDQIPPKPYLDWPSISVVVCSYNGAGTIRECFEGLRKVQYPNFEVIVVDDGSSDATPNIAREFGFRLIRTENRGLSSARNTGIEAATGEIVAFIDDDACPDPHWLAYLATTFRKTRHAAVGGPNIAPPGDGTIADCVDQSPGNPTHVLLSDSEAEHVPGCNMAVRRAALVAIGGFDPQFRIAGDDVDVCWRLQQKGWTLGFSPGAMVWHHRRNSVFAFWKQQLNYGKAEALLERKWPEKYNAAGHLNWAGRVYANDFMHSIRWRRGRIYHGTWGSAPFQSLYQPAQGLLRSLILMPEYYLLIIALAALSAVGVLWEPLLLALPLLALAGGALVALAATSAARASFTSKPGSRLARLRLQGLTLLLHLLQPMARLCGRLRYRLSPWWRSAAGFAFPWPRSFAIWSENWQASEARLRAFEETLKRQHAIVLRGGDYDRWDLEVREGILGATRTRMAIEEHGAGQQLVRFRFWPRCSPGGVIVLLLWSALAVGAGLGKAEIPCAIFCVAALLVALRILKECAGTMAAVFQTLQQMKGEEAMKKGSSVSSKKLLALSRGA